jgi:hypothetical protein
MDTQYKKSYHKLRKSDTLPIDPAYIYALPLKSDNNLSGMSERTPFPREAHSFVNH